jgi:hypothetical protein
MTRLKSLYKSILLGGAAAGIISLIPVINLLNLLLMMWMAFGGGLCVYVLLQENRRITASDALLSGALSGALGCGLFGSVTYLAVTNISPEKFERILAILRLFSSTSSAEREIADLMQGNELNALVLTILGAAFLLSLLAGALGGLVSRMIFKNKDA